MVQISNQFFRRLLEDNNCSQFEDHSIFVGPGQQRQRIAEAPLSFGSVGKKGGSQQTCDLLGFDAQRLHRRSIGLEKALIFFLDSDNPDHTEADAGTLAPIRKSAPYKTHAVDASRDRRCRWSVRRESASR